MAIGCKSWCSTNCGSLLLCFSPYVSLSISSVCLCVTLCHGASWPLSPIIGIKKSNKQLSILKHFILENSKKGNHFFTCSKCSVWV